MSAMDKAIKKEFIKYTKEHFPEEAEKIIQEADEIYPDLYAKAPDIGGKENLMSYNLDMFILALSFYEASDHRIDGNAIIAKRSQPGFEAKSKNCCRYNHEHRTEFQRKCRFFFNFVKN